MKVFVANICSQVTSVSLIEENEEVTFSKDVKSAADNYLVE